MPAVAPPPAAPPATRHRRVLWRALVPVTAAAAGLLLVSSAVTARGTELRASRAVQAGQVVARQQVVLRELSGQAARLRRQISAATARAAAGNRQVRAAQEAAARYARAAGLTPVTGRAVTVTLDDAPRSERRADLAAGARPDDLVIHQQDVQGVVNALWAGGAEAMTVMGLRVVATTAVRCVGNTLLLHDRVFSPPFRVTAVGDPARLRRALAADPDVQVFRQYVAAFGLGYDVTTARATLPAYRGPLELSHADVAS